MENIKHYRIYRESTESNGRINHTPTQLCFKTTEEANKYVTYMKHIHNENDYRIMQEGYKLYDSFTDFIKTDSLNTSLARIKSKLTPEEINLLQRSLTKP